MCNAVVVIVVVATFFTVSVLFYSVVFAFSLLLLLLLYVLLFIWQGGTRRDVKLINRPWHVGPKSPYSNNNNLGIGNYSNKTHTRIAES